MGRDLAVQQNQASAYVVAMLNSGGNSGAVEVRRAFTIHSHTPRSPVDTVTPNTFFVTNVL